jgi:hypothetical protein
MRWGARGVTLNDAGDCRGVCGHVVSWGKTTWGKRGVYMLPPQDTKGYSEGACGVDIKAERRLRQPRRHHGGVAQEIVNAEADFFPFFVMEHVGLLLRATEQ